MNKRSELGKENTTIIVSETNEAVVFSRVIISYIIPYFHMFYMSFLSCW